MILDPNKKGIDLYYDNKLRCLEGSSTSCLEWIIDVTCMIVDDDEVSGNEFLYKGIVYEQLAKVYLDCSGFGRVFSDLFDRVGFRYEKLDINRIRL